jgi:hypothetical protein
MAEAVYPRDGFSADLSVINNHPLIIYPDDQSTHVFFEDVASSAYSGLGGAMSLFWAANSNIGDVVWYASFERDNALGQNIYFDSFAPEVPGISQAAPVVGRLRKVTFTLTNADLDGIVAGDPFRIRIRRDGGVGFDNMVGDAQLFRIALEGI